MFAHSLRIADREAALIKTTEKLIQMPIDIALGSSEFLYSNRVAQPLLVASMLVMWDNLRSALPNPTVVAGYSVGEVAAYSIAGMLQPEDAVSLAARRARAMDAGTVNGAPQALLSVSGIQRAVVSAMASVNHVYIAIETTGDSCIIGGSGECVIAFKAMVEAIGARCSLLRVQVASHTPLLSNASDAFFSIARKTAFKPAIVPVVAGITGNIIETFEQAPITLSKQLSQTIRWEDCMTTCVELGASVILDLGPGASLAKMFKAKYPHLECRSVDEFRTIEGIKNWYARST
jgi:[acyl-carrier-protein] S-malonyltransferase